MYYTEDSPCSKNEQFSINDQLYCVSTEPFRIHRLIEIPNNLRMVITAVKSNPSFTINYNTQGNFKSV